MVFGSSLALVLGWATTGRGIDYYVSPSGADSNSGTSTNAPFQTIGRAAGGMVAGDNCYLRGGTYRETMTPVTSGSSQSPITFAAYNNESVTISGADVITGWTLHAGSIYQAVMGWDLGDGFNQVFVDGQMMIQARYPNTGMDLLHPTLASLTASATNITGSDLNQPNGFWTGGIVVGGFDARWTFQCARITGSVPGTLSINQPSAPWFNGSGQGFVTGVLGALDTTNEWHYQAGSLYVWGPGGGNPSARLVEAKRRAWCVDINNRSNIVVRGLKFFAGSVRLKGNACTLEGCAAQYLSHFTYFPNTGWDAAGGVDSGHNGVFVNGNNHRITNCGFQYSSGSGLVLQGNSNAVTRCVIRDMDYSGTYSCPLSLNGRGNHIWLNSMFNTGRDIIQLYGSKSDDIRYNELYNCGLLCGDLGITYQWGADGQGTRIAYNWIHDNLAGGPGVYLDNYCRNFVVDHNVIWNFNLAAGVQINRPATNHLFYNNTLFLCDDLGTHTYDAWPNNNPDVSFWTSDIYQYASTNNLFLGVNPASQLQNYANSDFRLKPGAAAIDAGVVIPGFTDGYLGAAPDRGANEFGGRHWTAGTNGVPLEVTSPTINQAAGQADPTSASPINFTVVFSESVTGFATGDVTITGTAPGTKTGTVTGSGTTYNVAVSGMTGSGTVVVTIAAGVAQDAAGNSNTASTSTDDTVTYDVTPPRPGNPAISYDGGMVTIIWDSGVLQQADDVIGIYTDVPGAVSPYTIAVSVAQKFYRTRGASW
jgi:hypothetical protein